MKKYRIAKILSPESVRQVCISHNYYTRGTCRDYDKMFSILNYKTKVSGSNISPLRLEEIAEDIKIHSNTEDTVEDIMSNLVDYITCSLYVQED